MEQIYTAIQAAQNQDASGFRDAIHNALAAKVQDALDMKRIEVASSFLNPPTEEDEQLVVQQEIVPDEDV